MKVVIGSDHAGFELKQEVIQFLRNRGDDVIDSGTHGKDSVDYPDFAHQVAKSVARGDAHTGIVICGTGNGVAMAANKHDGIRCGLCWNEEIAKLIRQHNDANILALPGRFMDKESANRIVEVYLTTEFEGGRHARRVGKIGNVSKKTC